MRSAVHILWFTVFLCCAGLVGWGCDPSSDDDDSATDDDDDDDAGDDDASDDSGVCPGTTTCNGGTYGSWAAQWWQWLSPIDQDTSPVNGGPCDQFQVHDSFFLTGNTGGTEERACTVPAGEWIFFPLVNTISLSCPEVGMSCDGADGVGLVEQVDEYIQGGGFELDLRVDGLDYEAIADLYAVSEVFELPEPWEDANGFFYVESMDFDCATPWGEGNACGVPAGPRLAATAGYWTMLEPLDVGEHEIYFRAFRPGDEWTVEITYTLTAE